MSESAEQSPPIATLPVPSAPAESAKPRDKESVEQEPDVRKKKASSVKQQRKRKRSERMRKYDYTKPGRKRLVTDGAMRRLCRAANIIRIRTDLYDALYSYMLHFLSQMTEKSVLVMQSAYPHRSTIKESDVMEGARSLEDTLGLDCFRNETKSQACNRRELSTSQLGMIKLAKSPGLVMDKWGDVEEREDAYRPGRAVEGKEGEASGRGKKSKRSK